MPPPPPWWRYGHRYNHPFVDPKLDPPTLKENGFAAESFRRRMKGWTENPPSWEGQQTCPLQPERYSLDERHFVVIQHSIMMRSQQIAELQDTMQHGKYQINGRYHFNLQPFTTNTVTTPNTFLISLPLPGSETESLAPPPGTRVEINIRSHQRRRYTACVVDLGNDSSMFIDILVVVPTGGSGFVFENETSSAMSGSFKFGSWGAQTIHCRRAIAMAMHYESWLKTLLLSQRQFSPPSSELLWHQTILNQTSDDLGLNQRTDNPFRMRLRCKAQARRPDRSLKKLAIVGDHRQLGPTVLLSLYNEFSAQEKRSFMSWMIDNGHDLLQLRTQYRMHPDISAYVNNAYYDGRLLNDPSVINRPYDASWKRFAQSQWLDCNVGHSVFFDVPVVDSYYWQFGSDESIVNVTPD
ncbi:MAG: hypothetical protein Q9172_006152 [Xanthocarpia lactea]